MGQDIVEELIRLGEKEQGKKEDLETDNFDRLNHALTTTIFMFATAIVLSRQFVGKPIHCWIPNEFTASQREYAETFCWVTSTYFILPSQSAIPDRENKRYVQTVYYYQWVPFALMIQGSLFSLPCIIWRLLGTQSNLRIWTFLEAANEATQVASSLQRRNELIQHLVQRLEEILAFRHKWRGQQRKRYKVSRQFFYRTTSRAEQSLQSNEENGQLIPLVLTHQSKIPGPRPFTPKSSSYLSGLYLVIKALYLINSTIQFYFVGRYISGTELYFEIKSAWNLLNNRFWDQSGLFPRLTLCDFKVRRMGSNIHRYTIQCVLRVNIFNEKIYIFIWFWLLIVTLLNAYSFINWYCKSVFQFKRIEFIENLVHSYMHEKHYADRNIDIDAPLLNTSCGSLTIPDPEYRHKRKKSNILFQNSNLDRAAIKIFTDKIISQDGVFLLRLVCINVNQYLAIQIVGIMWNKYRNSTNRYIIKNDE